MVDEKESVENDEAKVDGEAKEPAKKAGRPAKRTPAKPAAKDGEDKSAVEKDDAKGDQKPEVEDNSNAPSGRIVQEGEEVEIETREDNGHKVAAETVYRKKLLPKSSRYTYILVASEGTKVD